ncbi:MAG TPA: LysR family transcriptional regulator [Caldimonas sp.]|jgi:DNA-binding transcriptional LysR family regulator|nr:LysR family transcriptional regulator [Caldimonas sp.]HEX4234393.1 LysR family transcriptional regulator [Caldimonas sp.]
MDLRRWAHIVAVADCRSFVRAAEQVHLSQPALTRSIQAAEAELGLLLFDRRSNDVAPTPAGEFVVARARQLVFDSRCVERDVDLYRDRRLGDVAFGVGPFPAATFLAPLLVNVQRQHPTIAVRVQVGNWQLLVERLLKEDIEFFVADTRDLPADPLLQIRPLPPEPGGFYVRAGHLLPERKLVALKQLWSYGIAAVRLPEQVRLTLVRLLGIEAPGALSLALECDDLQVLKSTALACDLVLASPHRAVEAEVGAKALRALAVADLPPLFSLPGVVTLRGRTPSPMAERVISMLPSAPGEAKRAPPQARAPPPRRTLARR